ncbi:hypothetical protein QYF36_001338 [Acer negundo]|nr:hypothetical protein QYF36_001338 [Acer negundo]
MKNGENFLEKLITSCNGKYNPIRSYSAEELKEATNNYDIQKVITSDASYELYKGQRIYDPSRGETGGDYWLLLHVKKCNENNRFIEMIDPVIVRQVLCARKVQQLQACNYSIWLTKKASTFSRLNSNSKASTLSNSDLLIAESAATHPQVNKMVSFWRKEYQEKRDKTKFIVKNGEILLEKLITTFDEKKLDEDNLFIEAVDPIIVGDGLCPEIEQQLKVCKELAVKCLSDSGEDRPTMIDAAKQLRQLYLSTS